MERTTGPAAHGNRIAGAEPPAEGGGSFELRPPLEPEASLGTWPRSDARDVRAALAAAAEAGRAWARTPPAERGAALRAAAAALEGDAAGVELVARALGLRPEEAAAHARGLADALARSLPWLGGGTPGRGRAPFGAGVRDGDGAAAAPPPAEGVHLLVLDWTELLGGTLLAVAGALGRGAAAVLLADPRLPVPADRLARALEDAGVPPGVLAVVHGAHGDALPAAVAAPAVRAVAASGPEGRVAAVRRLAQERVEAGGAPLELELDVPAARTEAVPPGADPARAAEALVDAAFGRVRTLSGQLPGRVGCALVPPRLLSRLTERLLAAMEASPDVREPVPLVDRAAVAEVKAAWSLGLDEGATLVAGGELWTPPSADPSARPAPGERRVRPAVFTNVEPTMEIARRTVPGPVLRLVRDLGPRGAGAPGPA